MHQRGRTAQITHARRALRPRCPGGGARNAHGSAAFAGSGSVSAFRIRSRMCHSRHRSPGAIFWRLVFGNVEFQLSTESERSALVDPVKRYAPKQQLDGQDARLPALDDGLYPVALANCDAISS